MSTITYPNQITRCDAAVEAALPLEFNPAGRFYSIFSPDPVGTLELQQFVVQMYAAQAESYSESLLELAVERDIYRHAHWAIALSETFTKDSALRILSYYEEFTPNNPELDKSMDLFNNSEAIDFAIKLSLDPTTPDIFKDKIITAMNKGIFKYINPATNMLEYYGNRQAFVKAGINNSSIYVRSEPNFFSSTSYGSVAFNSNVRIISDDGIFSKIEYSNGQQSGYVYSKHLELIEKRNNPFMTIDGITWYNPYWDGFQLNQAFNDLDTNLQGHLGHDIAKSKPEAKAICAGTVMHAQGFESSPGNLRDNGYILTLKHNVNGKEFYSHYSHLEEDSFLVPVGAEVSAGTPLAIIGTTGNSTGDHLHLGVYTGVISTRPFGYVAGGYAHFFDFSESQPSEENILLSEKNAIAVESPDEFDSTLYYRKYYDFEEVIRTNAQCIN